MRFACYGDFCEPFSIMRVLLVEPDTGVTRRMAQACGDLAHTITCRDFATARAELMSDPPDVLVTNLRLADYNGLHLVLLARCANRATRAIVHTDRPDVYLGRELQANGAFFEHTDRLVHALASYLRGTLPARDRRTVERCDRRNSFRGGRRAADQSVLV